MLLYFLYCVCCLVFRSFLFVWLLSFFDEILHGSSVLLSVTEEVVLSTLKPSVIPKLAA